VLDDEIYRLDDINQLANETNSLDFVSLLEGGGIRSFVHISVQVDGHPVIGLGVASRSLRTFSEDELDALRNVADQVGTLIYSRTLIDRANESRRVAEDMLRQTQMAVEALGQRVSILQAVNDLAIMTASSEDYQTLLNTGARVVVELTGVDHSGIVIMDPNPATATVVAEYPPQNAIGAQLSMENNGLWDALKRDPTKPVLVESVATDTRLEPLTRSVMETLGIKSIAILPLVVDGVLRGGVGLDIYEDSRSVTTGMIESAQSVTAHLSVALRTQELLRETKTAAEQLATQVVTQRTINQLAQVVNQAADEETLRDATMEAMFAVLPVDHCGLVMLDESGTWGTVVSDYPPQGVLGLKFEVAHNPLLKMMTEQERAETIAINDVVTSPLFDDAGREALLNIGSKALLLVPVLVDNRLVGSFGMDYFSAVPEFSDDVIEIAESIMRQFATGLNKLRLLADTRRRADQLEHIARLGQAMQSTLDLSVILREVLLETIQMLPVDQMSVALYEPEQAMLRTVAEYNQGQTSIDLGSTQMLEVTGRVSQAWLKRELVYIPDLQKIDHSIGTDVTIRSWVIAPIISRSRGLGILSLGSTRVASFAEADLAVVQQLASQVAATLDNVEAFAQSQRIAKNEALVNTISTRLQQQLEVSNMLDVTVNELGRALGARRARIRLGNQPGESERKQS
jgi:GAF domain-containing protein